jgi:N-acetylglucosamine-6-sulfatase
MKVSSSITTLALAAGALASQCTKRPNIVLIMTDDQDKQLDSLSHMPILQRELVDKGLEISNHFATVSVCCPSRASFLRGQMAHSTNITNIAWPGGNYDKFRFAGEDLEYLPHWIKLGGYKAEYVGKFMNGHSTANYHIALKGWDHSDALLEPYINDFNNVVMSADGERPVQYKNFHTTDVVRIKSLARLETLLDEEDPFFLAIMPYAPHTEGDLTTPPTPLARHNNLFPDLAAPRHANFNPSDEVQQGKSVWMKNHPLLNETAIQQVDLLYRKRIESLQGIDEIVEDVLKTLEDRGQLENTYVIFTSDNGYHAGAHRSGAGKTLPYIEDTNLPLIIRGPGIPEGSKSDAASAHLDFVPTFLEIMGVPEEDWPELLDGRSLLSEWLDPEPETPPAPGSAKEIVNIEYWGPTRGEIPLDSTIFVQHTYKTLRIVSPETAWLYVVWCTNEVELYNTTADPWEINNLARGDVSDEIARTIDRLNAILMVTKSCVGGTCRDPWSALQPPNAASPVATLPQALDPAYDEFYAGIPSVHFSQCIFYQDEATESPFYPEGAENGLGKEWRIPTPVWSSSVFSPPSVPRNAAPAGGEEQRHATLEELLADAHALTDEEIGLQVPREE